MRAALIVLALTSGVAQAQDQSAVQPVPATAFDSESGPGFLLPGFQLQADVEGSKTARLTLSRVTDNQSTVGETGFSLTLSGTFDKDEERGTLITERGLTNGFGAEASVTTIILGGVEAPRPGDAPTFLDPDIVLLTATAGVGYENFKYRLPDTFAQSERDELSYSIAGSAAIIPNSGSVLLGAGFEYRRYFEAPKQRILCPAAQPVGPLECVQAVFGPPEENVDAAVFGVVRALAPLGAAVPVAAELRLAYDIEDDVFGVEAPIYVFLDANRRFRGGIQLGWDSRDEEVRAGLFVGVPLDFLKL